MISKFTKCEPTHIDPNNHKTLLSTNNSKNSSTIPPYTSVMCHYFAKIYRGICLHRFSRNLFFPTAMAYSPHSRNNFRKPSECDNIRPQSSGSGVITTSQTRKAASSRSEGEKKTIKTKSYD